MPSPVIRQHKSNFVTAALSVSATFDNAVLAGNMILVWVGTVTTAAGQNVNTPTMTGETFVNIPGASNGGTLGGSDAQVACFSTNKAVGGQTQVTATISGATNRDIHIHIIELVGQAPAPIDATGTTESVVASVSTSTPTKNPSDLNIAFYYDNTNNPTLTPTGGYSQVEQTVNTPNGDTGLSESLSVSTTGIQTATATGNGTDILIQAIISIAGVSPGFLTFDSDILMGQGRSTCDVELSE